MLNEASFPSQLLTRVTPILEEHFEHFLIVARDRAFPRNLMFGHSRDCHPRLCADAAYAGARILAQEGYAPLTTEPDTFARVFLRDHLDVAKALAPVLTALSDEYLVVGVLARGPKDMLEVTVFGYGTEHRSLPSQELRRQYGSRPRAGTN